MFVAGLPSYGIKHVLSHLKVVTYFTIPTYDSMLPAPLKTCLELMGLQTVINKELQEESDSPVFKENLNNRMEPLKSQSFNLRNSHSYL